MPNFRFFWLRLAVLRCQAPVFGTNGVLRAKEWPKSDGALDGAPCTWEGDAGRVRKVGRGPAPLLREAAYLLATARPTT